MKKRCHTSTSTTIPNPITTTTATKTSSSHSTTTTTSSSSTTTTTAAAATTTTSSHIQTSLKSLNKASYKISKPLSKNPNPNPARPSPPPAAINIGGALPQQSQPPVYNIDKNDFRDIIQKLTGSPAHHHPIPATPLAPPPPAAAPTVSSHLHRIHLPPLAHLAPPHLHLLPCPYPRPSPPLKSGCSPHSPRYHPFPSSDYATDVEREG